MKDSEILQLLEAQLTAAEQVGPGDDEFRKAINYYYCRPRGDEKAGRSIVQSSDVRDMVHAVMSQIMPTFTQDSICQFEPDGPDDEAMSRLESDATNAVMMERSRGFTVFYEAVKDALLFKNGVVKVYLEEEGDQRYIRVSSVAPENFRVGADVECVLLYRARFVAERKIYSRADLVSMGLDADEIGKIPTDGLMDGTQGMRYRNGATPMSDPQAGWANELVTIWECYAELPKEQDSTSTQLHRCLMGQKVLLLVEPVDAHPYAAGSGFIEPHKFWGLSLADLEYSVQDSKTAIQRQWLDNLVNCNNSRTVVNEQVNLDDLLTGRPGGVVRTKGIGPVQEAISPLPVIDVGPAAASFLGYMDQARADRGGAALTMASGEMQSINAAPGFQSVDRIYSVQEALAGMIARTLAETLLRSTFMQVHRLLRMELAEPMTLRLQDQWVTVDPSQWRVRDRVNIRSGLSPGERSRKAAAMTSVISLQAQALSGGMDDVMVTLPNMYTAFIDWCTANDLDAGEKYFTDPKSQSAIQAMGHKAQEGQAQQQQQQQVMQLQVQLEQAKLQNEQLKIQVDQVQKDAELKFKYLELATNAEVEEAKLTATVTTQLQSLELEASRRASDSKAGSAGAAERGAQGGQ